MKENDDEIGLVAKILILAGIIFTFVLVASGYWGFFKNTCLQLFDEEPSNNWAVGILWLTIFHMYGIYWVFDNYHVK